MTVCAKPTGLKALYRSTSLVFKKMASNLAQVVGTLLDAASDEDEAVEESVRQALVSIGEARPPAVLSASLKYLEASAKIDPRHRVQILKAIQGIVDVAHNSLDVGQTGRLSTFACEELINSTKSSKTVHEWESTACQILVALTRNRACSNTVMEDLCGRVSSGEVPHHGVVLALSEIAHKNSRAFVPFFSKVLSRLLPMFGAMQTVRIQSRVAQALESFSEAVLHEESQSNGVVASAFASRSATVASALNALASTWMIQSRDPVVRGSSAQAIGCMSRMVDDEQLDGALAFVLGHTVSLLRRERADSEARLGLVKGLEMLLSRSKGMAESHLAELLEILHQLACIPVDYGIPMTIRVHAELLRCIGALTRTFPDKVIQFLLKTLENTGPSSKVGTCLILKYLVNAAYKDIVDAGLREHIISGALKLITEEDFQVRGAFAEMIVAMGKAGFLTMGGGRELVLFVVDQCGISDEEILAWEQKQKGWFSSKAPKTSPKQLRAGCERFVEALGQCAEDAVWPLLLTTVIPQQYDFSLTPVTSCLATIANKKHAANTLSNVIHNSDVPKTPILFARLVIISSSIAATENTLHATKGDVMRFKDRGWAALDLLLALSSIFPRGVSAAWAKRDIAKTLGTTFGREILGAEEDLDQGSASFDDAASATYEDDGRETFQSETSPIQMLIAGFETVEAVWLADVGDALVVHLESGMYENDVLLKAALFAALGAITACLKHGERPRSWLAAMVKSVNHSDHDERHGLAVGLGLAAGKSGGHVDTVLQTVAGVLRDETTVKSSGWFGSVDEKSVQTADSTRATMLLALGSIAYNTPLTALRSPLEAHIVSHIKQAVEKLPQSKRVLRECVAHALVNIGEALGVKDSDMEISARDEFLVLMSTWVDEMINTTKVAEQETLRDVSILSLRASAALIRIRPAPSFDTIATVVQNILPLVEISSVSDEEDVVLPLAEVLKACLCVYPTNAMVQEILFSSIDKCRLDHWACSTSGYQRLRSTRLLQEVMQAFHSFAGVKTDDTSFPFEQMACTILPRIMDSERTVRIPAITTIDALLTCKLGNEGASIFSGSLKAEQQRRRLENAGPGERLAAFRLVVLKCMELFDPKKVEGDAAIMEVAIAAVNDPDEYSAQGGSEVLLSLFHHHGKNLDGVIPKMILGVTQPVANLDEHVEDHKEDNPDTDGPKFGCLILALEDINRDRDITKQTTLAAVRSIASYHFKPLVDALLATPVPLHSSVIDILVALSSPVTSNSDHPSSAKSSMLDQLAEHLTQTLNEVPPGSADEPNSVMLASHYAMEALLSGPGQNVTSFVDRHLCPLACTLLLSVGSVYCSVGGDGVANESAVDALRQLFVRASVDRMVAAMAEQEDEYIEESTLQARLGNSGYDQAIAETVALLCADRFDYQEQILETVEKFLSGPNSGQRVAATAMCSTLLKVVSNVANTSQEDKGKAIEMLKKITKALLGRVTDSEQNARKHAFCGLGYLATCKSMAPLLSAMPTILNVLNNGIDDQAYSVKNEALLSLTALMRALPRDQTVQMVMNVCFRVQSAFSCKDEKTRMLTFRLLQVLCSFKDSTGGNFEEQCFAVVPVILMHLNTNFDVSSAAVACLNDMLPLLGDNTGSLLEIVNKYSHSGHRGASIDDFDPFIEDFIGVIIKLHPNRAEAWVSKSKQLVSAEIEWPDVRGCAAIVLARFVSYLEPSVKTRVNLSGVCSSLTELLRDEDGGVRSRGAQSLAFLKSL